jgi:hypothetical protein
LRRGSLRELYAAAARYPKDVVLLMRRQEEQWGVHFAHSHLSLAECGVPFPVQEGKQVKFTAAAPDMLWVGDITCARVRIPAIVITRIGDLDRSVAQVLS